MRHPAVYTSHKKKQKEKGKNEAFFNFFVAFFAGFALKLA